MALPAAGMRTPVDLASLSAALSPLPTENLVRSIFDRIRAQMDLAIDPADLLPEFHHHVAFMLNRMRYSLHVGDSLLPDQVRDAYPVAYRMATIARDAISERPDWSWTTMSWLWQQPTSRCSWSNTRASIKGPSGSRS